MGDLYGIEIYEPKIPILFPIYCWKATGVINTDRMNSFEQVSPLIVLRILWVICMGLKFMNQGYLFKFQYTVVGKLRVSAIWIA